MSKATYLLPGTKFGRLTIVVIVPSKKPLTYLCNCDCGNKKEVRSDCLKGGYTKSCGCLNLELISSRATHGHSRLGKHTLTYTSWERMKRRCLNPNSKDYQNYGAKGIKVCDRWLKFENFLEDMGEKPTPNHSIDRIDNSKGYEPVNCKWSTKKEQAINRKTTRWLTFKGETLCLKDMAKKYGMNPKTLSRRLKKGKTLEAVLNA